MSKRKRDKKRNIKILYCQQTNYYLKKKQETSLPYF